MYRCGKEVRGRPRDIHFFQGLDCSFLCTSPFLLDFFYRREENNSTLLSFSGDSATDEQMGRGKKEVRNLE